MLTVVAGCGSAALEDPLAPVPTRVEPADIQPPMLREQWKVSADLDDDGEADAPTQAPGLGLDLAYIVYGDVMHARSVRDGRLVWTARFVAPVTRPPLALASGGVAVLTDTRLLWLDPDGAVIGMATVAPARMARAYGDHLALGHDDGVSVFQLADGAVRPHWSTTLPEPAALTANPQATQVIVTTAAGSLHVYALADGSERWSHHEPPLQPRAPAVEGERMFVLVGDTRVMALNAANGRRLWTSRPMGTEAGGSPVARDALVWVPGLDAALHGLGAPGGSDLHRVPLAGRSRLDLTSWRRWVIASPEYGPLTLVHGPQQRLGPGDPGQPRVETIGVDGDLEVMPASGPAGVLVADASGAVRLLTSQAGPAAQTGAEANPDPDGDRRRPGGEPRER